MSFSSFFLTWYWHSLSNGSYKIISFQLFSRLIFSEVFLSLEVKKQKMIYENFSFHISFLFCWFAIVKFLTFSLPLSLSLSLFLAFRTLQKRPLTLLNSKLIVKYLMTMNNAIYGLWGKIYRDLYSRWHLNNFSVKIFFFLAYDENSQLF